MKLVAETEVATTLVASKIVPPTDVEPEMVTKLPELTPHAAAHVTVVTLFVRARPGGTAELGAIALLSKIGVCRKSTVALLR